VQEDLKSRGDFLAIRAFPKNNGEIPDEMETQLVILGLELGKSCFVPSGVSIQPSHTYASVGSDFIVRCLMRFSFERVPCWI